MSDRSAQPQVEQSAKANQQRAHAVVIIWAGIIAPFGAALLAACGSAQHPAHPVAPASAHSGRAVGPVARTGAAPTAQVEPRGALPHAIGSARPLVVRAAAPDGSWVAYCTVPEGGAIPSIGEGGKLDGPALHAELALGNTSRSIDAFLDSDPTGRWLVFVEGGRTLLLDARTAETVDLDARGADTRQDGAAPHVRRTIAFDPSGPRVAWVERNQNKSIVVRRDLETKAETRLDAGNGEVWRIDFVPGTDAFAVEMVAADTSGNGRIDWPVPHAASVADDCVRRAPVPSQAVWVGRGDAIVTRIVTAAAPLREIQGFVGLMNDGVVQREPTGRLVVVRGSERTPLADAKCNAWIYDASAAYGVLLGGCTGTNPAARTHLTLWSLTGKRDLDLEVNPVGPTRPWLGGARLIPVYPGRDAAVIDLEHRGVVNLKTGDSVLATWKNRILVLREGSLVIHDSAGAPESLLAGTVAPLFDLVRAGPAVVATPLVVDLEGGVLRGSISGRPLAVSTDGRVLVATGGDASATGLAVGPLVWESPVLDAK